MITRVISPRVSVMVTFPSCVFLCLQMKHFMTLIYGESLKHPLDGMDPVDRPMGFQVYSNTALPSPLI